MLTIIASVLGIVATLVAWNFNPKRRIYAELDAIYKELSVLYAKRDNALVKGDEDTLTAVTARIVQLSDRKATLLQRLG
jgi:hypothetical protein